MVHGFLEGLADDASRSADAHVALAQLATELRADRQQLAEVREQQVGLSKAYDDLLRWLGDPASSPGDSIQAALDQVAFLNRTLYPRRGAWRALTSSSQLVWVGDQGLVTRLANFYESLNARLEYMGRDHDFNVNDFARVTTSRTWDSEHHRLRVGGQADAVELREQVRYLRLSWNVFYIDLLDEYGTEADTLLRDLESYLAEGDT